MYGYPLVGTGIAAGADASCVAKFQQFIHVLNKHQIGAKDLTLMDGDSQICSIEWGMNLVAFHKCSDAQAAAEPQMLAENFDSVQMANWIAEARSTNPKNL